MIIVLIGACSRFDSSIPIKLMPSSMYLCVFAMRSVCNECVLCDYDGTALLRQELFVTACEFTRILDDILSTKIYPNLSCCAAHSHSH